MNNFSVPVHQHFEIFASGGRGSSFLSALFAHGVPLSGTSRLRHVSRNGEGGMYCTRHPSKK